MELARCISLISIVLEYFNCAIDKKSAISGRKLLIVYTVEAVAHDLAQSFTMPSILPPFPSGSPVEDGVVRLKEGERQ